MSVKTEGIRIAEIPADIEWAMLIAYHRGKLETIKESAFYEKYKMFSRQNDMAVTPKGCSAVRVEREIPISHLEKNACRHSAKKRGQKVLQWQTISVNSIEEPADTLMRFSKVLEGVRDEQD